MTAAGPKPADVLTTPTTEQPPAPDPDPAPAPAAPPAVDVDDQADVDDQLVRGRVVTYVFKDPVTGAVLDGFGIVLDVPDDGAAVCVAPVLRGSYLFVPAEDVQAVELGG